MLSHSRTCDCQKDVNRVKYIYTQKKRKNLHPRFLLHCPCKDHGGNTIGTTCVVDRDDTAYMVVDREFRLPTE